MVSALEYMGDNPDQLLARYGEGKFWVEHACQNMTLGMDKSKNPGELMWQTFKFRTLGRNVPKQDR